MNYSQDILVTKHVNKDLHESLTEQGDLFYLLNGDISGYENSGNLSFVQNVLSNEICYRFPTGSKFHGAIPLDGDEYVLFISNEETSSIIYLDGNCNSRLIVAAECLNFQGEIKGVYKKFGCGRRIYWVENCNSSKYLDIDECIPTERISDCNSCEIVYGTELDCNAIKFDKDIFFPCVETEFTNDGNIPNGAYQVAIAFSENGVRFTDYFIYPNPIKLHSNTGQTFGINVKVDSTKCTYFDEYELVLISNRADRSANPQRIGFYNVNQSSVFIDTLDEAFYTPIDLSLLTSSKVYYESASDIAINTESLVLSGLKLREKFDYRLAAQSIKTEWVSISVPASKAKEYYTFMRDEVYAIDIAFQLPTGEITPKFHIPSTNTGNTYEIDGTEYRATDIAPESLDHPEATEEICNVQPKKIFEIYNTGTVDENSPNVNDCIDCEEVINAYGKFGYWESNERYSDDYPMMACKGIRHHKFPDHCVSHIHSNEIQEGENGVCTSPCVNIMTIRLKDIPKPIDCKGNEIETCGYIVYVSDRRNHKSVLHKGMLYNTRNFEAGCEDVQFSNYPFNDLQEDVFLGVEKYKQGNILDGGYDGLTSYNQDKFTYHSPDIHYVQGAKGTELKLYTNEVGRVRGEYHETEGFPKYQLLSPIGRIVAQAVGVIEGAIAMRGQSCTTSVLENVCKKVVDRTTEITGFPVANITGDPIGGGGTVPPGLINGTGSISNNSGGGISTDITENDYSQTTLGDPDCETPYELQDYEINTSTIPLPGTGDVNDGCILVLETNAEFGANVTITIDNQLYTQAVDANGNVEFDLSEKCDELEDLLPFGTTTAQAADALGIQFNPDCECTGDTETRTQTTTTDCDERIDFLKDLDWGRELLAGSYYYINGINASQRFLTSILKPKNYAMQYTAKADYNSYTCCGIEPGNTRRLLTDIQYLEPINQYVGEDRFHNWCSENADYLKLDNPINDPCIVDNTRVLHKEMNCGSENENDCYDGTSFPYCSIDGADPDGTGNDERKVVEASSYYAGIKRYNPNQYGKLDDYVSKAASCVQTNFECSDVIYGGDVHITQMTLRRKMPLFNRLPLGLSDNTEFDYSSYFNIDYPRYWMDVNQEGAIEDVIETIVPILGNLFTDYNLENVENIGTCFNDVTELLNNITDFSGAAGIASGILAWLSEMILSQNFYNIFQLQGMFYTHVTGISCFWVESEFINDFREYNEQEATQFYPNKDISELAKSTEYHNSERFLYNLQYHWDGIIKAPESVVSIDCCEKSCVNRLAYSLKTDQENNTDSWLNFLPNNYQVLPSNVGDYVGMVEIDDYNLFLAFEDGVFVTQQDEGLLTQDGSRVYLGTFNAFERRLQRLSTERTGYTGCIDPESIVPTRYGVFWFDRKRRKFFNYANQLSDLTGDWQSWFNEFLSKNDNNKGEITGIYDNFTDRLYFTNKEIGWTISYSPKTRQWISHHSFIPDAYYTLCNNFLSQNEAGLWKHNKKGEYQVYYGVYYPFEIGTLLNTPFKSNTLQSLDIHVEFLKYHGYDCKTWENKFFDKIFIHNSCGTTGMRDLFLRDPEKLGEDCKDAIAVAKLNCNTYRMNGFTAMQSKQPYYCVLDDGCKYRFNSGKITDKNLTGDWFKVHLISDNPARKNNKILTKLIMGQNDEFIQ